MVVQALAEFQGRQGLPGISLQKNQDECPVIFPHREAGNHASRPGTERLGNRFRRIPLDFALVVNVEAAKPLAEVFSSSA